jgi:hypothetical protein
VNTQQTLVIFALVAALGLVTVAAVDLLLTMQEAEAIDISCTNGGGQQPRGQQPSCKGRGLTQDTTP